MLAEVPEGGDYPDSVAGAVMLTHNRLRAETPGAAVLAELCAWLAPEGLGEALFAGAVIGPNWQDARAAFGPEVVALLEDPDARRVAFKGLRRWSVISDCGGMHRLTQAVLRGQGGQAMAKSAAAVLAAQFPTEASVVLNWSACRRLLPHVTALWAEAGPLWQGNWGKPGWAAMDYLLNQAGIFLSKQSDWPGAIALKRGSLDLTEAMFGESDWGLTVALGNLALNLAEVGDLAEAQVKIDRAVALDLAHRTAAERADLATSYLQQASIAIRRFEAGGDAAQGAEALAEAALGKARALLEELFGDTSAEMSNWWNQRGYFRRAQGRKGAEIFAYRCALDLARALPGFDRAEFLGRATNFGGTALELGRAEEAQAALREAYQLAVEIYVEVPDHPHLQKAALWLTRCLFTLARKGQQTEAEARAICARHGLDPEERRAGAARFPLDPVAVTEAEG